MEQQLSDEELMIAYQDGDAYAFEILYQKHRKGLFRYILRFCNNPDVTEELYQDVWMKLINARHNYQIRAKFTTWLYQIAHNHVIDYLRRENRSRTDSSSDLDSVLEVTPARVQEQPDRQVDIQQQTRALLMLIEGLPAEQREVLLLKEEGGLGLQEIAEITASNQETVKSRLRYALKKIRTGMQNR